MVSLRCTFLTHIRLECQLSLLSNVALFERHEQLKLLQQIQFVITCMSCESSALENESDFHAERGKSRKTLSIAGRNSLMENFRFAVNPHIPNRLGWPSREAMVVWLPLG